MRREKIIIYTREPMPSRSRRHSPRRSRRHSPRRSRRAAHRFRSHISPEERQLIIQAERFKRLLGGDKQVLDQIATLTTQIAATYSANSEQIEQLRQLADRVTDPDVKQWTETLISELEKFEVGSAAAVLLHLAKAPNPLHES